MIVGVQGSKNFNDYSIYLRAMTRAMALFNKGDKEFTIMSAGPQNVNGHVMEFTNIAENTFKSNGVKVKVVKVPPSWFEKNMHDVDFFAYFCQPKESVSPLVRHAEDKDVEVAVYRY